MSSLWEEGGVLGLCWADVLILIFSENFVVIIFLCALAHCKNSNLKIFC